MAKRKRATRLRQEVSWIDQLTEASIPVMLIGSDRRISFVNRSLADWVGLSTDKIIGRLVEYHSEPDSMDFETGREIITGLCPPPAALAGNRMRGSLSSLGRDGRLHVRRSEFLPIRADDGFLVLAVLELADLSAEEMAKPFSTAEESDFLHRQLRLLRRESTNRYSIASLVGNSSCMRRVRAQVAASARSRAHTLIAGPPNSGRSHLAKVVHYSAATTSSNPIVSLDCRVLTEELLRRGLEVIDRTEDAVFPTLVLSEIELLNRSFQNRLASLLQQRTGKCQMIATIGEFSEHAQDLDDALRTLIGTVTIDLLALAKRREDIPLLVQYFLEEANREHSRQVGSASQEALELLALHRWPGEIAELREVIHTAHARCAGSELQASDLPPIVHHAAQAAQFAEIPIETISLDEFLLGIERELVLRAMEQSQGNKAQAARLLGMTRPRLYRRLVQLGLIEKSEGIDGQTTEEFTDEGT